jgi:hypothetical protein
MNEFMIETIYVYYIAIEIYVLVAQIFFHIFIVYA